MSEHRCLEIIAEVIATHSFGGFYVAESRASIALAFADQMGLTYPNFNRMKFLEACGVDNDDHDARELDD